MGALAPTTAEIAQRMFEASAALAPKVFLDAGGHAPIVLVGYGDGLDNDTVMLDLTSDEAADASFAALQELYQAKCLWFVSLVEMWTLPKDAELAPGQRPSQHKDRIECLLVQGASRDGVYARQIAWQIIRNGDALDLIKHWDEPAHSERFEQVLFGREVCGGTTTQG